ncbi:esyt3 [Symbiodinium sp. CCMP2456]|nr:esyt3 [Symbiodinium sp. CCMP2456]
MRTNCEPALQSVMPAGITICFGDKCSLGTKPAQLQSIIASKYCEDPLEESTTIRLDAQLNYVGDSHVDVTCTVGSLVLTQLQVTGEIVIELVRLQKNPPWFSGVRIYFSNRPKIDLVVQTEVLGLNANFEFIKHPSASRARVQSRSTSQLSARRSRPHHRSQPLSAAASVIVFVVLSGVVRVARAVVVEDDEAEACDCAGRCHCGPGGSSKSLLRAWISKSGSWF